jgi:spermidine synthase
MPISGLTPMAAAPARSSASVAPERKHSALLPIIATVFFFSGFSSLVYEVIWMRRLALFFGSDIYSAAFTLSAFMGGLTLGSLLAARYTDRLKRTLGWYGLLEILIGLYALFFTGFLNLFATQYRHVYTAYFDSAPWLYHGFRILVATLTLLIPTTMMGATLPLIVKHFGRSGEVGRYSGFFYSMNTFGALAGVLAAGFLLLPSLGMKATTVVACAINLIIGITALILSRAQSADVAGEPASTFRGETTPEMAHPDYDRSTATIAMIAICLSGLAALALEVVWMRILVQVFCATVYAFAIMLSCFLFGIFYGSKWISRRVDRQASLLRLFGLLELGLGVSVASLATLTYFVPALFARMLFRWIGVSSGHFAFGYVAAQFIVSGCPIIAPTLLMGATFPVAVRICTPTLQAIGRGVASVYAANTVGAIAGALLGGMVLIPAVGTRKGLLVIATIFVSAGLLLLLKQASAGWSGLKQPVAVALLLLFVVSTAVGLAMPQQTVTNLYNYIQWSHPQVIYHGEGVAHNVDIFRIGGITTMTINGGGEADTSSGARRQFFLKAHLPLLLHPDPKDVAVVGLGLGITLSATNRNPNVENIEVIELTREMVKAQSYLEDVSGGVLHSPKVHVRIDDGRNFMAMSDRSFDMITADPVHPRNTGVGYLYTTEYYESIKRRLRPQGVVCQWMPMYEMSKKSFDVAFRSFASVFPNASLWLSGTNALFIATVEPFQIDYQSLTARMLDPVVKADFDSIGVHSAPELLSLMVMGPKGISRYLASTPNQSLNTDDNAYLEYHVPFDLPEKWDGVVRALLPYASLDLRDIHNISPEETEQVRQAWDRQEIEFQQKVKAK